MFMKNLNPSIKLEQQLGCQVYVAPWGAVVEDVIRKKKDLNLEN